MPWQVYELMKRYPLVRSDEKETKEYTFRLAESHPRTTERMYEVYNVIAWGHRYLYYGDLQEHPDYKDVVCMDDTAYDFFEHRIFWMEEALPYLVRPWSISERVGHVLRDWSPIFKAFPRAL